MGKIGLGIVTCNREDFFKQCYKSVPTKMVDVLVAVNDGDKLKGKYPKAHLIEHKTNMSVGVSKNDAFKYLIENDCEHIFLIEDDIIIKNPAVFTQYIRAANESGLMHLMYGYHGNANKVNYESGGKPNPRVVIEYKNDVKIALNANCVGAFCYYHKSLLDEIGLMDETYINAWEHIDHSYSAVKKDLLPGYWWWPDIANSYDFLDEQACCQDIENGAIRKDPEWEQKMLKGAKHFYSKYKAFPTKVDPIPEDEVLAALKRISQKKGVNA